jgi:hypothetical protein
MADVADRINDQLIRLGYSEYSGNRPGFLACPDDAQGRIVVMTHPTRAFDVAAYHAEPLLAALEHLPSGADWTTMAQTLARLMID